LAVTDFILAVPAFGPVYPDLGATVIKHRRLAAMCGGVAELDREQRQAYGAAVEAAIKAKQRSELQRVVKSHDCHCVSGTNHNTGEAIDRAMRMKHRAELLAYPSKVRRERTAEQWSEMYKAAMREKRAAATVQKPATVKRRKRALEAA
jgi:hypothetical protein